MKTITTIIPFFLSLTTACVTTRQDDQRCLFQPYNSETTVSSSSEEMMVQNIASNKLTGILVTHWPSGRVRTTCSFKNGETNGMAVWFHKSGTKWVEEEYRHGVKDGVAMVWNDKHDIALLMTYVDGKRVGPYVTWHGNGQRMISGWYESDQKHGKWRTWTEEDEIVKETTWERGTEGGK